VKTKARNGCFASEAAGRTWTKANRIKNKGSFWAVKASAKAASRPISVYQGDWKIERSRLESPWKYDK